MQQYLTALLIIVAKLIILDLCGGHDYTSEIETVQHEQSAAGTDCNICNRRRKQKEDVAACKSAIWISANMKWMQHEKCNMKRLIHKKMKHWNDTAWKKWNMTRLQNEKSATWKEFNTKEQAKWKECNMKKVLLEKM